MLDDIAIIELYNQRDENAIYETDCKYGRLLKHISSNIVHNSQDAEECVSDTYLKTWNTIPPTWPNNFKAFLLRIGRNIAINKLSYSNRGKRGNGDYQLAVEEIEKIVPDERHSKDISDVIVLRDILTCFLESLSKEQRSIFIGRYWYFDSVSEIANNLGISTSKVKMVLMRCRKHLKDMLEKEDYYV